MTADDVPVGSILLFTAFYAAEWGRGGNLLDEQAYAVRIPRRDDDLDDIEWIEVDWLIGGSNIDEMAGVHLPYDEFEIVPDDEVPDEVWAALAKKRLTEGENT